MKKILVAGGAGYIGSHICDALVKNRYTVRILDNFSTGLRSRINNNLYEVIEGDILNYKDLEKAFDGIDSVIHLAAKKSVEESVMYPLDYYNNNIVGTINILNAMKSFGVNKIIFSSTAAVYSPDISSNIKEDHPTMPLSPYGQSKLISEQIISKVSKANNFSTISLRYFNVVGSLMPEYKDNSKNNLVPKILDSVNKDISPEIYGDDYDTKDGTCVRDYIHVVDLSEAHLYALKKIESENINEVYNVGSGTGYSVKDIMCQVSKRVGFDLKPKILPRRSGDCEYLVASIEKIKNNLGWYPKLTLEQMIQSA